MNDQHFIINNDDSFDNSNQNSRTKVITKRKQDIYTHEVVTSRHIRGTPSTIDGIINSSKEASSSIPVGESTVVISAGPNTTRTITTTVYRQKVTKRTYANGVVTIETTEEGNPNCRQISSFPELNKQSLSLPASGKSSTENIKNLGIFAPASGLNNLSDSVDDNSSPFNIASFHKNLSNKKPLDYDILNQPSTSDPSGRSTQITLPDGSTMTRKFFSTKSTKVTESETVDGETKRSERSEFMCYAGESIIEANSTMHDMEAIFKEMKAQLRNEGFDVLNLFMLSSTSNIHDHLSLAGGDVSSSLLTIEDSSKSDIVSTSQNNLFQKADRNSMLKIEEQEQEEVRKKIIAIKEEKASNRLYWSNMDEVKFSGILDNMKKEEIHLHESIFEIITSEASYNISLDILIDQYYHDEMLDPNKDDPIIDAVEKHHLFSNILLVKSASLKFLKDLENRWAKQKPTIFDLADIVLKHAEDKNFEDQYVSYIARQTYQIKCLKTLLQREFFKSAILTIQNKPQCCKLSLDSFLTLPMQRLTRLKLLLDVVIKLMNQSKELYTKRHDKVINNHHRALNKVKELLYKCENQKFKLEQEQRLMDLSKYLEFRQGCKSVIIKSKILIREGELKAYIPQPFPNTLKKLSNKKQPSFYLILLDDLLIIAKKKRDTKLVVLDHCVRGQVEVKIYNQIQSLSSRKYSRDKLIHSKLSFSGNLQKSSNDNLTQLEQGLTFQLSFKNSQSSALVEPLVLIASSTDCRDQWIDAITLSHKSNEN